MEREERLLRQRLVALKRDINRILTRELDRRPIYSLPWRDTLRLYTLWAWTVRYKVPLSYILRTLLPVWWRRFGGGRVGLGCRVATLVGKASEKILVEAIARDFPNGQNVREWAQAERLRATRYSAATAIRRIGRFKPEDPQKFLSRYDRVMQSRRSKISRGESSRIVRKPYRDNPWRI